jgi:microcin C transport system substrate-binding protein
MIPPTAGGSMRCVGAALAALLWSGLPGCGGLTGWFEEEVPAPEVAAPAPIARPEGADGAKTNLGAVSYVWDARAGDPAVPADLGGPGFTGEGWTTRTTLTQVASPGAPQGGTLVTNMPDWPATLRVYGPHKNTSINVNLRNLTYQTLLDLDPVTTELIPSLATHWWISPDRLTFRFRINPAARWSDGTEVTAEDVLATYRLLMDPTLQDSAGSQVLGHVQPPVALSKYVIEVTATDDRWTNFYYFATDLFLLPAAEVGAITGAEYLDRYQFAYTGTTGPYTVRPEDVKTGSSLALTRRRDWWMEDNPSMDGWFNFDRIQYDVVKDPPLAFEKVKKGELDYFVVQRAQWWAEDIPLIGAVKRGLLVPHKFFNEVPGGFAGIAINLHRPPLDDVNVRRALQMLYDRERMIEKLLYKEYDPLTSFFPNSAYANPANEKVRYDEAGAVALLERSGWTEINEDGYRVKDGKSLAFTLTYATPPAERFLTLFQASCQKAGIKIDLQLLSASAAWKAASDKEFTLYYIQWSGVLFPNPETMWSSALAFAPGNNNITGYVNPNVDALLDRYTREYDLGGRADLLRQVDALLAADLPYVLTWYPPSQRVLFWNRFGMPPWGTARTGTWAENEGLWALWWVDPAKDQALTEAREDPSRVMEPLPMETHFWPAWSAVHAAASSRPVP